jgi:hypothetical protein
VIVRLHLRLGLPGAPAHLAPSDEPRQPVSSYSIVLPASGSPAHSQSFATSMLPVNMPR